ncbi:unnamed protein product [Arabidopsis halleri]
MCVLDNDKISLFDFGKKDTIINCGINLDGAGDISGRHQDFRQRIGGGNMTTMVEVEEGLNQGPNSMTLLALCSFCCHIRSTCFSLRFASESLLLCPPFTKLSWSYKTESEKGLTSYVRWKVEPFGIQSLN